MKRRNLEQHLRKHGCVLERESKHSIWKNPTFNVISAVPRHAEIPRGTVRAICRDLRIPSPFKFPSCHILLRRPPTEEVREDWRAGLTIDQLRSNERTASQRSIAVIFQSFDRTLRRVGARCPSYELVEGSSIALAIRSLDPLRLISFVCTLRIKGWCAVRTLQLKRMERAFACNQDDGIVYGVADGVEREPPENGLKIACASQRLANRTRIG